MLLYLSVFIVKLIFSQRVQQLFFRKQKQLTIVGRGKILYLLAKGIKYEKTFLNLRPFKTRKHHVLEQKSSRLFSSLENRMKCFQYCYLLNSVSGYVWLLVIKTVFNQTAQAGIPIITLFFLEILKEADTGGYLGFVPFFLLSILFLTACSKVYENKFIKASSPQTLNSYTFHALQSRFYNCQKILLENVSLLVLRAVSLCQLLLTCPPPLHYVVSNPSKKYIFRCNYHHSQKSL